MRIWHILGPYPPDYGGGAAVTTREICLALAERGHDVRVLALGPSSKPPYSSLESIDNGVVVSRVSMPTSFDRDPEGWWLSFSDWLTHRRCIREFATERLRAWRPDIVDYHGSRPFGESLLTAITEAGVPLVATLHDFWLFCHRVMLMRSPQDVPCEGPGILRCLFCFYSHYDQSIGRAGAKLPWRVARLGPLPAWRLHLRRQAMRSVRAAVARSTFIESLFEGRFNGPVKYIDLGIEPCVDAPAARSRPRTPFRFGFVGGGQPTKGLADVLWAVRHLRRRGASLRLIVWGPPGGLGSMLDTAASEADVEYLGSFRSADRCEVYNQMDAVVMATRMVEPLGRVPFEASLAGVPTIAPAIGGLTATIHHERDGLLYRFRDPSSLAVQMGRVLEDPVLYQCLLAGARTRTVMSPRSAAARVEKFYEQVLEQCPGNAHPPSSVWGRLTR